MSHHTKRHETKILSIGAAVQDVYLKGKIFKPHRDDGELVEEFQLGSKNDLEGVVFSTGGGATNASVTFARQGLHAMYMGKIGHDVAGKAIMDDLHAEGVDTSLVGFSKELGSGYSCVLLAPNGERTIMAYRGASAHYDVKHSDFHDVDADWIFITSMDGNFEVLEEVFKYAESKGIKIAMNPGKKELEAKAKLKKLIPKLTILSMNKEEMQQLYEGKTIEELVRAANKDVHYVIVTDGPKGAVAADRWHLVSAGMYEDVPVIDRTGAGDAFSSGFTAMIAAGESLEDAVIFASANSTNVVSTIGAKAGILHHGAKIHAMPLKVVEL
ncbi:MAG: carbohydrate kinase family protein [Candidatus Saccharimonadales bacterium]